MSSELDSFQFKNPQKLLERQKNIAEVKLSGSVLPGNVLKIREIIVKAESIYGEDLDSQAQFVQFHAEQLLGKRIQVFIRLNESVEGYWLHASNKTYIQVIHEDYLYTVWQVDLDQDFDSLKH